jgi:hypothetical protein
LKFTSLATAALLAGAGHARAQDVQAGVIGGYGVATTPIDHDPYLFTIGAQAGVTLPIFPLYLGARVLWFSGELQNARLTSSMNQAAVSFSLNYLMLAADVGYDLEVGPIVLRPLLSVGRATLSGKLIGPLGIADRPVDNSLFVAPALALLVNVCCLYVSGELRYSFLTESGNPDGIALLLGFGARI